MITNALISRALALITADITHIGIGTGSAPIATDTVLNSEQYRKVATVLIDENTAIFDGYWDESEANGLSYTNAGVFGNGATNTIGSGQLMAGGVINIPSKNNTQTLTVSVEITVEAVE